MHVRRIFAECLRDIRCIINLLSRIMFATYWLNIRGLLTQSIRSRPNLHVKSEHLANIPQILVSHIRLCLPNNRRVFASCSQKLFATVHFFPKGFLKLVHNVSLFCVYKFINSFLASTSSDFCHLLITFRKQLRPRLGPIFCCFLALKFSKF